MDGEVERVDKKMGIVLGEMSVCDCTNAEACDIVSHIVDCR